MNTNLGLFWVSPSKGILGNLAIDEGRHGVLIAHDALRGSWLFASNPSLGTAWIHAFRREESVFFRWEVEESSSIIISRVPGSASRCNTSLRVHVWCVIKQVDFKNTLSPLIKTHWTIVKKAMLENIKLRSNWIITIENLINRFNLADVIGSQESFKKITRCKIDGTYRKFWKNELEKVDLGRLHFYREVKNNYNIEKYLKLEDFEHRKIIAKLRCSDQTLEIEKGRHGKMERSDRL